MASERKEFMVEDAQIIFRNFQGKEGKFNKEGERSFSVILEEEAAQDMINDGWNVKFLKPREDDEDQVHTPYIQVKVRFDPRPPRIMMMTSRARTQLGEDGVEVLDWADIASADLICTGFEYDVNGNQGVSAYLKSLFVNIEEDYLEQKYGVNEIESRSADEAAMEAEED